MESALSGEQGERTISTHAYCGTWR